MSLFVVYDITLEAFYDGSGVRYAIIYDKGGKDMWEYAQEKLLKKTRNVVLSKFLKEDIGLKQRTVKNENNDFQNQVLKENGNEDIFWIVKNYDDSQLHDKALYKKYESSHGAWFHLQLSDFKRNGLLDGVEEFESKIGEKFKSWEIEYKNTSLNNFE